MEHHVHCELEMAILHMLFHSVNSYVQYKIAFNIHKKHFEGKFYIGNMFTLVQKI